MMDSYQLHPHIKNLLLIGGGHSHVTVIKQLDRQLLPGIRVTLINKNTYTPYSGMLPGLIAGHYNFTDCHIDLRKLCQWAGIRFICSTVKQLDLSAKKIICHQYPPFHYDLLSINIGSQPRLYTIQGAFKHGHAVKPVKKFLNDWQHWLNTANKTSKTYQIIIIGGGAASIEVLLAMHYFIHNTSKTRADFSLICADKEILSTHNKRVQNFFQDHLKRLNIKIIVNQKVTAIEKHQVTLADGREIESDFVALAIDAGAQTWLAESGLQCDPKGFVQVDKFLRSISHPHIFAAGDCAAFTPSPIPKAGVYAVRQGPILAKNLIAALKQKPLRPFKPQHRFLSLLTTGGRHAVASRGPFFASGKWVWYWKNYIDRKFMARFSPSPMANSNSDKNDTMRCGGCGAKISKQILQNVLTQLIIPSNPDIINGIGEDAAIINVPANVQWAQSIDFFRQFIDDPYLVGRIAAIHCLGDIYAMGAKPHSALVIAVIPYSQTTIMEETLHHLMQGIQISLANDNTTLIGGHSSEGSELSVGLTINGLLLPGQALTKNGFNPGDDLILTKPLGTGVILAANMAAICQGDWLDNALCYMLQSNRTAATILRANGANGCTDVTGFGLLGHLKEILSASRCGAAITLDTVPVLDGARQCSALGTKSSLYEANKQVISHPNYPAQHPVFPLLFDPQTAGGLLAGIPPQFTDKCLRALSDTGYTAAKIGWIDKQLSVNTIIFKE